MTPFLILPVAPINIAYQITYQVLPHEIERADISYFLIIFYLDINSPS